MASNSKIFLLPDAGPLITLAYADALDVLFKPGWEVQIADMVLHEITRNQTPTSKQLSVWVKKKKIQIVTTRVFEQHQLELANPEATPRKNSLGELAIQEVMSDFALTKPVKTGVFLFEDHKIARASFMLPHNCRKVSTRAFLLFLEEKGWLESAAEIERKAILAGRAFSQLRFPP